MRVTVYSTHHFDRPFIVQAAADRHIMFFRSEKLNLETAALARGTEAVALFTSDMANAAVLEKLASLGIKYICLRSVGYDHIDLQQAAAIGIKVANIPEYSPYSVAEHACTLLLTLNRKIQLGQKLMDICDYRLDQLIGHDLHGKTVGIVGTGKIGAAFARIMRGFGCSLVAVDPVPDAALIAATGLRYVTMAELLHEADVISLHCPLNDNTYHLLNAAAFEAMKHGVAIINTSRGSVIDTQALLFALQKGKVSMAGLDVYEREKDFFFENMCGQPNKDDIFVKLRSYPNVLITGHQAFLTVEALTGIAQTMIANLDDWEREGGCPNDLC